MEELGLGPFTRREGGAYGEIRAGNYSLESPHISSHVFWEVYRYVVQKKPHMPYICHMVGTPNESTVVYYLGYYRKTGMR